MTVSTPRQISPNNLQATVVPEPHDFHHYPLAPFDILAHRNARVYDLQSLLRKGTCPPNIALTKQVLDMLVAGKSADRRAC